MKSNIITRDITSYISKDITLKSNGVEQTVYKSKVADFATLEYSENMEICISVNEVVDEVKIQPLSYGIKSEVNEKTICFKVNHPGHISVTINNKTIYLFVNPPETDIPDPEDSDVIFFKGGKVYDAGCINVKSEQRVYIEKGAIVRGYVVAKDANNIRIGGRGILATSDLPRHSMIVMEECENINIEGITIVSSGGWNVVLGCCNSVFISNIHIINWKCAGDGIDIVASQKVNIEDCFIRANDDCIAIKAFERHDTSPRYAEWRNNKPKWTKNVRDIVVKRCVLYNDSSGNALEIGFETQADIIENISFSDCDILAVHGHGGVFTIHNGDRAIIRNVTYENIRVEHYFDKLIDLRIVDSCYTHDKKRGHISNITFKNITAMADEYNTVSIIGGCDSEHIVKNVHIENFSKDGVLMKSPEQMQLYTNNCRNINFK